MKKKKLEQTILQLNQTIIKMETEQEDYQLKKTAQRLLMEQVYASAEKIERVYSGKEVQSLKKFCKVYMVD